MFIPEFRVGRNVSTTYIKARGAGNVYLLVLSNWKVNIAENPIAVMANGVVEYARALWSNSIRGSVREVIL